MSAFIDRTGQVFNNLKITAELGKGRVIANCTLCGSEKEYSKSHITCGASKTCGCKPKGFIDRTGQIFNKLKIVQELGKECVMVECLICGSIKKHDKGDVVSGYRKSCGCTPSGFIDRTGQTFNNLKILKELGDRRIICKCLLCESEKEFSKNNVTRGNTKSCGCDRHKILDRTGEVFGNMKIIKELGNDTVLVRCLLCKSEKEYTKGFIVGRGVNSCGCLVNSRKDVTGQRFKGIEVVKELGADKVIGRCIICNTENNYTKHNIIYQKTECKNCGLTRNYKGQIVNNVKVLRFAYTGRDKNKYYICKCTKCGEELILTREEIIKHTCTKE